MAIYLRATVLVLVGAGLGLGINAARARRVSLLHFAAPTSCEETAITTVKEVNATDAMEMCGKGDFAILDTRPADVFAQGHIANATHLPCDASGDVADAAAAAAAGHSTVIVYGDDAGQARQVAQSVAERLPRANVMVLQGGFAAWQKAGLACTSGSCEACAHGAEK